MPEDDTPDTTDETGVTDESTSNTVDDVTEADDDATQDIEETSETDDGVASGITAVETDSLPEETPPQTVIAEAERLTRQARDAVDEAEASAYRADRENRLDDHDYTARVREDDTRDVLVMHPQEWVEDGTIRTERIDDIDRGIEIPLSGPGEADDWAVVDEHNRDIVETVRAEHGEPHAANVSTLADFMSNHYAKPIESATREELQEFLDDYFLRNAWPTDEQRAAVEKSVKIAFATVDERCPLD